MTNTSNPPLEIKHDQIDTTLLEALRKIDEVARKHETSYFLAGATAREIILRHVFGRPPGRRTLDVDLGIAVRDWDHFKTLKSALVQEGGFRLHSRMVQRLTYPSTPSVVIDLIPFGGVEKSDRVRLGQNLIIPVVTLPVLLVLKLFAWRDRKHEKRDAPDIYTLLKEYGEAGNEDRLYGEELNVLEAEGYDFELAGARLIARDAARVVSEDTRTRVREILESDALMEDLTNQIILLSARNDVAHVSRCEMLIRTFREGFLHVV
jgi:predicted nucleotidyltransferase